MHEDEKFYSLMALVCRRLPHYAVQMAIDNGYPAEQRQRLHDVKRARTTSLPDLVALVRHALPQFEIPANLLPAPAEQEVATA